MAEDLTVPRVGPAERAPSRGRVHARKFVLAYLALALVAAGAIAGVAWAIGLDRKTEQAWSAWQPTKEGEARMWEIADVVGAKYVDVRGRPIVQLLAAPPYVQVPTDQGLQRIQVDGVLVKGRASDRSDARAGVFRDGTSFMYILCSTGGNCDLTREQNADANLGLVLQREVLELALYTFKYNPELEHLLFFLPPFRTLDANRKVQRVETVVYFERHELSAALERPLSATLAPGAGNIRDEAEIDAISSFVRPRLFVFDVEQAPQGLTILTLERYTGR